MADPIVLDTCVFRDKSFLKWVGRYHGRKIVPTFVYAETAIHYLNRGKRIEDLDFLLRKLKIEVESHEPKHARYTANLGFDFKDFSENARDYLISGHAYLPPCHLITNNVKDFFFLENRVHEPYDFIKMIETK